MELGQVFLECNGGKQWRLQLHPWSIQIPSQQKKMPSQLHKKKNIIFQTIIFWELKITCQNQGPKATYQGPKAKKSPSWWWEATVMYVMWLVNRGNSNNNNNNNNNNKKKKQFDPSILISFTKQIQSQKMAQWTRNKPCPNI